MTEQLSRVMIDLTMDDEGEKTVDGSLAQKQASTSHSRSSSAEYIPAITQKKVKPGKKSFSSYEIKSLSESRIAHTRLPDILQLDQKKNIINKSHPAIFVGWVQEHEESSAPLSITNDVENDDDVCPPADWMYTDGYVLDKSLEPRSRRVGSSGMIPKGCNCDNDLGICDPRKCACYVLHEKLAPNPWVEQDKDDADGNPHTVESDIRGRFAYNKDGRLRPDLVSWAGTPIWECNSNCSCTADCSNRVVQKGRTVAFDLFKSPTKGWGIRTGHKVKAGTFITVYAGELLDWAAGEDRNGFYENTGTTYVLDIDSHHIQRNRYYQPYLEHLRASNITFIEDDKTMEAAEKWAREEWDDNKMTYSVDAGLWGNLSRYFNHSCEPNMNMHPVYTEERDIRRPFLSFFANRDIDDGEELTFRYDTQAGEELSSSASESALEGIKVEAAEQLQFRPPGTEVTVKTSDRKHNLTSMKCNCGATTCTGTVYRLRGAN
jgi:histone-lysine N-methyltransferase SUV39H